MVLLLLFTFISGLVTLLAPCIWPILPIVLSSSASGGKKKALGVTIGISFGFSLITLSISYLVSTIPFDPDLLRLFSVGVLLFMGATLVVPKLKELFASVLNRLLTKFGKKIDPDNKSDSFFQGVFTGFVLGAVWSPCAGPILATIATLGATRSVNTEIILVTITYAIGLSIPLFLFTVFGNWFFTKTRFISRHTAHIQEYFGIFIILAAIAIYTGYDKIIQIKLLEFIPSYSNLLYKLEGSSQVRQELRRIRGGEKSVPFSESGASDRVYLSGLPILGKAPDFSGISTWLNTEIPLTISELKGKVVLVDFWTYSCVNCIRTLPFLKNWYEKYRDKGFVIVGIHTPEFEFEKKTENVKNAVDRFAIKYPVGEDNSYKTWDAYNNNFWPAKYLIDAEGNIRLFHFGEGSYQQIETAIQNLINEKGTPVSEPVANIKDETPKVRNTPETYLGSYRLERFSSNEEQNPGYRIYSSKDEVPLDSFSLSGNWNMQQEYSEGKKESFLRLHFRSEKVFLVIHPKVEGGRVKVFLDGGLVSESVSGKDVIDGVVIVDSPRLYEIVDLKGRRGEHELRLELLDDDIQFYAFTFG